MSSKVIIKELQEVIVYSKRMKIKDLNDLFVEIPKLGEQITKANPDLQCRKPEYCFIIDHDKEFKQKDIDMEFCEAVVDYGKETDGIIFKKMDRIPKAACILHKGPYETLFESYNILFNWIEENNYKISDKPRTSYIDGIWNKEDPNEWLTEVQIPIANK